MAERQKFVIWWVHNSYGRSMASKMKTYILKIGADIEKRIKYRIYKNKQKW
jgi:hypothetical protein